MLILRTLAQFRGQTTPSPTELLFRRGPAEQILLNWIAVDLEKTLATKDPEFRTRNGEFDRMPLDDQVRLIQVFSTHEDTTAAAGGGSDISQLAVAVLASHLVRVIDLELLFESERDEEDPPVALRTLVRDVALALGLPVPHVATSSDAPSWHAVADRIGSVWIRASRDSA